MPCAMMRPCLEGLCLPEGLLFVRELVRSFVVRRLVPPEPLANAANDSWQLELHVCDVIQLGSQRVLQLNTQRASKYETLADAWHTARMYFLHAPSYTAQNVHVSMLNPVSPTDTEGLSDGARHFFLDVFGWAFLLSKSFCPLYCNSSPFVVFP